MLKLSFQCYQLLFKNSVKTSRSELISKNTYLLKWAMEDEHETEFFAECNFFKGLSPESEYSYEKQLEWLVENFHLEEKVLYEELREFPSIQFGVEQLYQAQRMYSSPSNYDEFNPLLFPSNFTEGQDTIQINGLIWMGSEEFMEQQIHEKLQNGFACIKLKIGVDWEMEKRILNEIRNKYKEDELEIRVDANGGFEFSEAKTVLEELYRLKIHSIEQPIQSGNIGQMADLCANTPIPIALDEELIGKFYPEEKAELLQKIKPQYIILKPSLVGGWKRSEEWISLAEKYGIGWWITSALESNIGLNAIAQWTYTLGNKMPQGLGTGGLYKNNFYSRLQLKGDQLYFM